jgi:hypothetical protein
MLGCQAACRECNLDLELPLATAFQAGQHHCADSHHVVLLYDSRGD